MNRKNLLRMVIMCVCTCMLIVCAVQLVRYAADYYNTRNLNRMLAAQYHAENTAVPTVVPTDTPAPVTTETSKSAAVSTTQTLQTAALATAMPKPTYDPFGGYPNNRNREISEQFKQLQKTNKDICGWITIGSDLDQAVVQRDNNYYLTRDYTGKSNSNGAIFLDEQVKLWQRPTCYILYGHNMKTQEMFGMLHKYDETTYLYNHAVITFNTQYEDGQYAVFASGTLMLDSGSARYANYYNLPDAEGDTRLAIIDRLRQTSDYVIPLEVSADDQLLILITCVGDDRERRFIAARRLRDGENSSTLNLIYLLTERK